MSSLPAMFAQRELFSFSLYFPVQITYLNEAVDESNPKEVSLMTKTLKAMS